MGWVVWGSLFVIAIALAFEVASSIRGLAKRNKPLREIERWRHARNTFEG